MIKKWLILLVTFTALPLCAQHSFEIAYETSRYTYREPDGNTPIRLKGRMQGASVRYEKPLQKDGVFIALDGRWMGGSTDYDGWLMDTPPIAHQSDDIGDYYYEGRVHTGGVADLSSNIQLWISFGVAYRYLKDHLNKDPYGYLRESNYLYMPFAVEMRLKRSRWKLDLKGEFDHLLLGWQYSHMASGNIRHLQRTGYGVRFSAKVQFNIDSKERGVFVEPFYRYWNIQDSESNGGYIEPHNTTQEIGLRAGLTF